VSGEASPAWSSVDKRSGRLDGKAGIITGAASGLGRAVLQLSCAEGARVVAVDRDSEALDTTVAGIRASGGEAIAEIADVTKERDVERAVQRCVSEYGACTIVDNNAAIAVEERMHETSAAHIDAMLTVNLKGAMLMSKHAIRAMLEHGGGSIVNTGSIVTLTGDAILPVYGSTKAGLAGLTRALATDYAAAGIRCNCICPGDILTPMLERTFARADDPEAKRREIESYYPVKRIADPIEIARVVVFMLSDEASFMTGSVVAVDGGLTAKCY
jgi:NAD(P)-dependent dehydrogenase (short-subunit alcohol dehydrogenase family)